MQINDFDIEINEFRKACTYVISQSYDLLLFGCPNLTKYTIAHYEDAIGYTKFVPFSVRKQHH